MAASPPHSATPNSFAAATRSWAVAEARFNPTSPWCMAGNYSVDVTLMMSVLRAQRPGPVCRRERHRQVDQDLGQRGGSVGRPAS